METYLLPWKKFVELSGRSARKEYWTFVLINIVISLILGVIDRAIGTVQANMGILSTIFSLVILIPMITVTVRRLHDIGRTGWWLLLIFIPLIGQIVLLVFMVLESQPGDNRYGSNPHGSTPQTPQAL